MYYLNMHTGSSKRKESYLSNKHTHEDEKKIKFQTKTHTMYNFIDKLSTCMHSSHSLIVECKVKETK